MQLEHYFVEEVSFNLQSENLESDERLPILEGEDLEIEVALGEGKDDRSKRFCQLTVNLSERAAKTFPYNFRIQMLGFFNLDSTVSEPESEILMTNGAPSLLYTAAREYFLLITGRTRFHPLMLPTIFFAPNAESEKENESKKKRISNHKVNESKSSEKVKKPKKSGSK